MSKKKEKNFLRAARNWGIPALIWAVCTVNPLLVIAFICSWVAESGNKRSFAKAAEILYIIGGALSTLAVLGIAALGGVISLFSGIAAIAGGASGLVTAALVADLIIAAAVVDLRKGRRQLTAIEEKKQQAIEAVGFFGSEVYANEEDEDKK